MKPPILITGCARSGTSMTAGIIDICGAWGGKMSGSTRYNQKGMFENTNIRQDVIKPLLRSINCDPMGQFPLPTDKHLQGFTGMQSDRLRDRVLAILKLQGLHEDTKWFYKGAKLCLVWTLWHKAFPEAKWVVVRRDPKDIAESCMRTGFMRAYDTIEGWLSWVYIHEARFEHMREAGLQVREVWPHKMVQGSLKEMREVVEWLELDWREFDVIDFITPALWRKGK
ncbi:hypothetical protein LCGC14_0717630 [marine sediment metagenome]|uniref:Sulfotransferase domain-containing protein n=1 Tax=marine sediment metagenome TaxID=412755 RepID=A0A0F9TKS3_9ZZZZ